MRLRRRRVGAETPAEAATGARTSTAGRRAGAGETYTAAEGPGTREAAPVAGTEAAPARERAPVGAGRMRAEEAPRRRRRGGIAGRTHEAAGATAGALGSGVLAFARLVMTVAALIALLIALAIVLRDVDANSSNTIVKGIHEGANFFAGAFTGLIKFSGHPKRAITVDWGIALIAYLLVGAIVSRLIAGIGRGGLNFERRHRTVPMH